MCVSEPQGNLQVEHLNHENNLIAVCVLVGLSIGFIFCSVGDFLLSGAASIS